MSLAEVRALIPGRRPGQRVGKAAAYRWVLGGFRGPDGAVVRLRAIRVGSTWWTCREWLTEFVQASTAARLVDAGPAVRSPAERQAASEAAGAELAAAGW